jgi:hypothetical protein
MLIGTVSDPKHLGQSFGPNVNESDILSKANRSDGRPKALGFA